MLAQEKKSYGKKVAIIGVGYVGAGIAYALMLKDTASEIVLIDSKADVANAEMLDIVYDYLSTETDDNGTPLMYRGAMR